MAHRVRLVLHICFRSRWHAGSGEGNLMTDRLIRRDGLNRPFIPGSTLKGIVRQSCEKLCHARGFRNLPSPHHTNAIQSHSPVDCLFGTTYEPGQLFFRDARLRDNQDCLPLVWNRVARHRILGTAKNKQLFSTEYNIPCTLTTTIDGWHENLLTLDTNSPPYEYCLLIAGILAVDRIGAEKSTGAGWLTEITLDDALYNGAKIDLDTVFDWFTAVTPLDYREMRGSS